MDEGTQIHNIQFSHRRAHGESESRPPTSTRQ